LAQGAIDALIETAENGNRFAARRARLTPLAQAFALASLEPRFSPVPPRAMTSARLTLRLPQSGALPHLRVSPAVCRFGDRADTESMLDL
jgi:hypothetical protein